MLFNSIEFLIFLPLVFLLYWFGSNKNSKYQNVLLLVASYFFYGWWSWKFLILLVFSTLLDYLCGFYVASENKKRSNVFLYISIILNLSFLATFKYYNFFILEFQALCSLAGISLSLPLLNVALPVGISFYTFHGMSYILDIYRKKRAPVQNIIDYSVFVAYFPLLVAGPIERANHLLPQIQHARKFDFSKAVAGLKLILWGFFKKVVIADSLSPSVDIIFSNHTDFNGGVLFLGALYFTIQIYCDFSGYSDIAIGTSKLFGIELLSNFNYPYFSKNIAEFWKKWHISLTSWFREYLYIPLGGSKGSVLFSLRNIFLVFIVSGFWHGANLTFIFWGLWHACLYVPYFLLKKTNNNGSILNNGSFFFKFKEFLQIGFTFLLIIISWVFFRSDTISDAFTFLKNMLLKFDLPNLHRSNIKYVIILLVCDWFMRKDERQVLQIKNVQIRWACYLILFWFVVAHFLLNPSSFIYFQF
jgi:alginate O-acetyltransferase complex protein AlgI